MLRKLDYICARVWENIKVLPLILFLGPLKLYWVIKDSIAKLRK